MSLINGFAKNGLPVNVSKTCQKGGQGTRNVKGLIETWIISSPVISIQRKSIYLNYNELV